MSLSNGVLFLLVPEMQEPMAVFLQVETQYSSTGARNRRKDSTARSARNVRGCFS